MPDQTLTFLFCDIESSTRLLQRSGDAAYQQILRDVLGILREALRSHHGEEVDTAGDGLFGAFHAAGEAVMAAVSAQWQLQGKEWEAGGAVAVRMGIHTGESVRTGEGYVGIDVHRAARICSAAHGGQILLSAVTGALVSNAPPEGCSLEPLGEFRLKGLEHPEQIVQVLVEGLKTDFPPPNAPKERKTNLPARLPTLIGREEAVHEVQDLLLHSDARMVTLTGAGGSGKTTLALHVASQLPGEFPDGVFSVSLVDQTDISVVPVSVCQALNVRTASPQVAETLKSYLASRRLLLLLDNAEQVEGISGFIDELVEASPGIRLLVTSRSLLRGRGEREYRVSPLAVPGNGRVHSAEELQRYSAVQLFVDRAVAARPDFALTDENAGAVEEICRRLDGLPLAIELAAARIKLFTAQALVERLKSRTDFLRTGETGVHRRHQTLRDTIDWSYSLLTEEEKRLFVQLSVFRGGSTIEAIEAVAGVDVLECLTALIDKSLVRQEEREGGEVRFSMLETIRDYAAGRLEESSGADETRNAHALYYVVFAERAEGYLTGPDQREWLDRLREEHDNFREVFRWVGRSDRGVTGLRLGASLWRFWVVRGFMVEGKERLLSVLGLPSSAGATRERAKVLNGLGTIEHELESFRIASPALNESLSIWRKIGDKNGIATTLNSLGWIAMFAADHDQCETLSREAMELHRELGNKRGVAISHNNLGWSLLMRCRYAEALDNFDLSRRIREELGDTRGVAFLQVNSGWALTRMGKPDQAFALLRRAIATLRELGDQQLESWALGMLGNTYEDLGEYTQALPLLSESIAIMSEVGNIWSVIFEQISLARVLHHSGEAEKAGRLLRVLSQEVSRSRARWVEGWLIYEAGSLALTLDDIQKARTQLLESIGLREAIGDFLGVAQCLVCLADIAGRAGNAKRAADLCLAARALSAERGGHLPAWEQRLWDRIVQSAGPLPDTVVPPTLSEARELAEQSV